MRTDFAIGLFVLLCAGLAQARDGGSRTVDYVVVRCDAAQGMLAIEKHLDAAIDEVPKGRGVRLLDRMVGYHPTSRDDGTQFATNDLRAGCRLAGAVYAVRLQAHVFGSHVQGRCGAAQTSVDASVTRDGVPLLANFLMGDSCGDSGTADMGVARLLLSERQHEMTLLGTLDDPATDMVSALELRFGFAALPTLSLDKVFALRPQPPASGASEPAR